MGCPGGGGAGPGRGAFPVGFFLLDEGGFGGLQRGTCLFEGDFSACGVEFGEQLALGDVGALGDIDLGDYARGLEAEVELGGGLDVAGTRDGRLDDALTDGDRASGGGLCAGGGSDEERGGDDCAYTKRAE